MKVVDLLNLQ